jgi:hypothetical protein
MARFGIRRCVVLAVARCTTSRSKDRQCNERVVPRLQFVIRCSSSVVSVICSNVLAFVSDTVSQTKGSEIAAANAEIHGRVNRFAPRGLSQYADDMQQFSFFFPITQPDNYGLLRLIPCPALQPIRAVRARCARHRTGWGWEGPARSSANHRCRHV